jgi:adenosylcobinamide kinase/adenosylcobinamide-phosphate guanylyltransferase
LHRQRRRERYPAWRTIEEAWQLPETVRTHGADSLVLVECMPLWLTSLLLGLPGHTACTDDEILRAVAALAETAQQARERVVVVSGEVGCGMMPMHALARRYGDLLGEANQQLAAAAEEVYWCVVGLPQRVK